MKDWLSGLEKCVVGGAFVELRALLIHRKIHYGGYAVQDIYAIL